DGDLDLLGDKSSEVRRPPGHTPGSQFAVVRLPKTGTVVLTSDVVYLKESLEKNLIPPIPGTWNPGAMYDSYQKLRLVRDGERASIFYGHDPEVFKATKQAPQFYEAPTAAHRGRRASRQPGAGHRSGLAASRATFHESSRGDCGHRQPHRHLGWRLQALRQCGRRLRRNTSRAAGGDSGPARAKRIRQDHTA